MPRRTSLPAPPTSAAPSARGLTPFAFARRTCSRRLLLDRSVFSHDAGSHTGCSPTLSDGNSASCRKRGSTAKNTALRPFARAAATKRPATSRSRSAAAIGVPAATHAPPVSTNATHPSSPSNQ
jgi:hypothetical protein